MNGVERSSLYLDRYDELRRRLLTPIWPAGLNPAADWDGTHYVVNGSSEPVSVSTGEAFLLANCAFVSESALVFEIGTGFGYSTGWLAIGVALLGSGGEVVSLDNYSEGELSRDNLAVANEIVHGLGVGEFVTILNGSSPEMINPHLQTRPKVQMAFIDGDHYGQQPLLDYLGLVEHIAETGAIFFHDVDDQRFTVTLAVDRAAKDGWTIETLNTSCKLTVAHHGGRWPNVILESFSAAQAGRLLG